MTSWQSATSKVEVQHLAHGRTRRTLGKNVLWVKNSDGEEYNFLIGNYDLYIPIGVELRDAKHAQLSVRSGPLGRFVNEVKILSEE